MDVIYSDQTVTSVTDYQPHGQSSGVAALTNRYLDLPRLAEYSSIPVRTLRDYLHLPDDPIPHYRITRKIFVRQSEFDVWMRSHRGKPNMIVDTIVSEVVNDIINFQ